MGCCCAYTPMVAPAPAPAPQLLNYAWGNQAVPLGTTHLDPWYSRNTSVASLRGLAVQKDGLLRELRVIHNTPVGAEDVIYTVLLNGVATALGLTLSTGAAAGSNLIDTIAVVAGDLIQLRAIKSTGGTQLVNVVAETILEVA